MRDKSIKERSDTAYYDLGNHFINGITKNNGPIITEAFRALAIWNQWNQSFIQVFWHGPCFKDIFLTSWHTKSLTSAQKYWKKPAWSLSTLGALNSFKAKSPCLISSSVTWTERFSFSSSDRKQQEKFSISKEQVENKRFVWNSSLNPKRIRFFTSSSSVTHSPKEFNT